MCEKVKRGSLPHVRNKCVGTQGCRNICVGIQGCDSPSAMPATDVPAKPSARLEYHLDSDDDTDAIIKHGRIRLEFDTKRIKLEEQRLEHERRCEARHADNDDKVHALAEIQPDRAEKAQALEECRIYLDEQKACLDYQDRKLAIQERTQMINLFASMTEILKK